MADKKQFFITDNAAKKIAQLVLEEDTTDSKLRISVLGGGCSGFQYNFEFDTKQNNDDLIFSNDSANVLIDQTSIEFIEGSSLDYVETLGGASFSIKNPNATANCGCGSSFSV